MSTDTVAKNKKKNLLSTTEINFIINPIRTLPHVNINYKCFISGDESLLYFVHCTVMWVWVYYHYGCLSIRFNGFAEQRQLWSHLNLQNICF